MKLPCILSIAICVFVSSCEQVVDVPKYEISSADISSIRSIEEAELIAKQALLDFTKRPQTKVSLRNVSTIVPINRLRTRTENEDTLFYVVNFVDSTGFALVAADRSMPELLVFVNNGNYSGEETDCPAFNAYIEELTGELSRNNNIQRSVPPTEMILFDFDTTKVETFVEPVISWNCHQSAPFNTYCLSDNNEISPAGCGAVAIAHAISRYSSPTTLDLTFNNAPVESITLDWSICKNHNFNHGTCNVCNTNALLMREIGERLDMHYTIDGSSSTLLDSQNCLTSLGYQCQYHAGYDIYSIVNSLNSGKTVIIRGDRINSEGEEVGHSWNVDGYRYYEQTVKCYYTTSNRPLRMYDGYETKKSWYLYFEYGWQDNSYDGYYIAYSRLSGDGSRYYESIDTELVTMFECGRGYTKDVAMLTGICSYDLN